MYGSGRYKRLVLLQFGLSCGHALLKLGLVGCCLVHRRLVGCYGGEGRHGGEASFGLQKHSTRDADSLLLRESEQ